MRPNYTAPNALRKAILDQDPAYDITGLVDDDSIEAAWEEAWEADDANEVLYEYMQDFRCFGSPTSIDAPHSRHYESRSVACEIEPCVWVGWTYWFGGGKYAEPEAIPWIEEAYYVRHWTETRTVDCFDLENDE